MKKPIKIYCELYGRNILVFHCWKQSDFENYIAKNYSVSLGLTGGIDGVHVCLMSGDDSMNVIWTRDKMSKTRQLIVLAHETLHATIEILSDAGVPIEERNDESICYYQGFLLKKIL